MPVWILTTTNLWFQALGYVDGGWEVVEGQDSYDSAFLLGWYTEDQVAEVWVGEKPW